MMTKIISIIIPVYNTELYLRKCLDSLIISENFDSLEVIIVNDGSTDRSLDIANKYVERYPHVFKVINKKNGGHGSCCNLGVELATGKYLHFLDSDDWFETETLSYLVAYLTNTDTDVFFTRCVKELVYENRIENYGIEFNYSCKIIDINDLIIPVNSSFPQFFSLANCGFNTEFFRKMGIPFSEKCSFDDTFLYLAPFINIKKVLFINRILYHYFVGRSEQSILSLSESKYHQKTQEYIKCLSVCQLMNGNIPKNIESYIKIFSGKIIDNCYYTLLNAPIEHQRCLYAKLQETIKSTNILTHSSSRFHKLLRHIPYSVVRILFFIRTKIKISKMHFI